MDKLIFQNAMKLAETGDLLLFKNKKLLFPKLIEGFGGLDKNVDYHKLQYSHVAIYLGGGDGLIFESSFPKGTQITPISHYFKDEYSITIKRLENITVNDISKLKNIIYNKENLHQKYDWFSFLGFITSKIFKTSEKNNIFGKNKKEFCASIVDDVWKEFGIDFFPNLGDKKVTPNDWANLSQFKIITTINI